MKQNTKKKKKLQAITSPVLYAIRKSNIYTYKSQKLVVLDITILVRVSSLDGRLALLQQLNHSLVREVVHCLCTHQPFTEAGGMHQLTSVGHIVKETVPCVLPGQDTRPVEV